jgi:hypothetical protein
MIEKRVRAERRPWTAGVLVAMWQERAGALFQAAPITLSKVEEGNTLEPMLQLSPDEAQVLMDDLWNCGIRPTEGTGSAGALAATQRHLDDMRSIALAQLNLPKRSR